MADTGMSVDEKKRKMNSIFDSIDTKDHQPTRLLRHMCKFKKANSVAILEIKNTRRKISCWEDMS